MKNTQDCFQKSYFLLFHPIYQIHKTHLAVSTHAAARPCFNFQLSLKHTWAHKDLESKLKRLLQHFKGKSSRLFFPVRIFYQHHQSTLYFSKYWTLLWMMKLAKSYVSRLKPIIDLNVTSGYPLTCRGWTYSHWKLNWKPQILIGFHYIFLYLGSKYDSCLWKNCNFLISILWMTLVLEWWKGEHLA